MKRLHVVLSGCDIGVSEVWIIKVLKKSFPNQGKLIIIDNFAVHKDNVSLIEYDKNLIKLLFFCEYNSTFATFRVSDFSRNNRSLVTEVGDLTSQQVNLGFHKTNLLSQSIELN